MAVSRKGNNIQKTLSLLLYGEQGTRKSTMCAEAIALKKEDGSPMKVLFIDAEFGGLTDALEAVADKHGVNLDNSYVVYTESLTEIMDLLDKVRNKEDLYYYDEDGTETDEVVLDADGKPFRPDVICLDGTTIIYNAASIALTRFSEKRAKVRAKAKGLTAEESYVSITSAALELKEWSKLNKEYSQNLILKLIATGCHHIVTAREVDEKQQVKTSDGQITSIPTGKKVPDGFKGMQYNVGTVVRLFVDEMGDVKGMIDNKDRTRTFAPNTEIDEPSLLMWQSVIDKNAGRKKVDITPTFSNSIEKEYERELGECGISLETDKESVEKELTPAEYHLAIKSQLESLKPDVKKAAGAKIKAAGLTLKYTEITDVAKLKQFMEIISQ